MGWDSLVSVLFVGLFDSTWPLALCFCRKPFSLLFVTSSHSHTQISTSPSCRQRPPPSWSTKLWKNTALRAMPTFPHTRWSLLTSLMSDIATMPASLGSLTSKLPTDCQRPEFRLENRGNSDISKPKDKAQWRFHWAPQMTRPQLEHSWRLFFKSCVHLPYTKVTSTVTEGKTRPYNHHFLAKLDLVRTSCSCSNHWLTFSPMKHDHFLEFCWWDILRDVCW